MSIAYTYETDFSLANEPRYTNWLTSCAVLLSIRTMDLVYAFMDDNALLALNKKYLGHNTFTDIITFDDTIGSDLKANIAISVDRVKENAAIHKVDFTNELCRVMAHGMLHCVGYTDKSVEDVAKMRQAEDQLIHLFHVEQNPSDNVC